MDNCKSCKHFSGNTETIVLWHPLCPNNKQEIKTAKCDKKSIVTVSPEFSGCREWEK